VPHVSPLIFRSWRLWGIITGSLILPTSKHPPQIRQVTDRPDSLHYTYTCLHLYTTTALISTVDRRKGSSTIYN